MGTNISLRLIKCKRHEKQSIVGGSRVVTVTFNSPINYSSIQDNSGRNVHHPTDPVLEPMPCQRARKINNEA